MNYTISKVTPDAVHKLEEHINNCYLNKTPLPTHIVVGGNGGNIYDAYGLYLSIRNMYPRPVVVAGPVCMSASAMVLVFCALHREGDITIPTEIPSLSEFRLHEGKLSGESASMDAGTRMFLFLNFVFKQALKMYPEWYDEEFQTVSMDELSFTDFIRRISQIIEKEEA